MSKGVKKKESYTDIVKGDQDIISNLNTSSLLVALINYMRYYLGSPLTVLLANEMRTKESWKTFSDILDRPLDQLELHDRFMLNRKDQAIGLKGIDRGIGAVDVKDKFDYYDDDETTDTEEEEEGEETDEDDNELAMSVLSVSMEGRKNLIT